MRKKIKVDDLRIGMYVDKLDGNWLQHPFWRTAFNLVDDKDLQAIKNAGIQHVWIDTAKGDDVGTEQKAPAKDVIKPAPAAEAKPASIPVEEELAFARETLSKAKQATIDMFQEARMGNSIKIADAAPLVEAISESVMRNPSAMLSITRMKNKDDYTYLHSVAVCALMIALGKQLGYKGDLQSLGMAGLLHDVGKMAIPEDVLNKPGKLTDSEFDIIKNHPRRGWEMLKEASDVDDIALEVCLHHHEKVDGSGYPDRLSGDALSLVARMGAVCDVYDAITSDRCYKKGWEPAMALKKMAEWKDGHFDDAVFKAFVKTVGIYPTGTLIKLHSGRLGVVLDQSEKTLLQPKIKVFYSTTSHAPIPPKIIDLTRSQETIESIEEPETWGFDRQRIMEVL
ncbi:MAG: HD-GYP domain-containing protein [Gammaproteobacteria bacterium]|nr:MAG: HD-GYP domain-containing protein [Gammaproteobacteria bacterium]